MSTESSNFRIDWSPSPGLCQGLRVLAVLAAASVGMSDLPLMAKVLLAPLALAYGIVLAHREAGRASLVLHPDGVGGWLVCHGARAFALASPTIKVRGVIASLTGRDSDGRSIRLFWGPDTLTPSVRRALRLASGQRMVESDPTLATMSG